MGVFFLSNDENVGLSGGKGLSSGISDMDNVEGTRVSFSVNNNTDSTQVTTSSAHDEGTNFVLNDFSGLSGGKIKFNSVVGFDGGVRVSHSSTVMESGIRDSSDTSVNFSYSAEFELSFVSRNRVDSESSLCIVEKSEVFVSFFDGNNIHETSRISSFSSNFTVDLNASLFHDIFNFFFGECVFESVSDQKDEWQAFSSFVGTRGGFRGKDSTQFVQHPVVRGS